MSRQSTDTAITNLLPDNTSGKVTPAKERQAIGLAMDYLESLVYSLVPLLDAPFDSADGTAATDYIPAVGQKLTAGNGTLIIESGKLVATAASNGGADLITKDLGTSDTKTTFIFNTPPSTQNPTLYLAFTANVDCVVVNMGASAGVINIYNVVGGAATLVYNGNVAYAATNSYNTVIATLKNSKLNVSINGVSIPEQTIPSSQTGKKISFGSATNSFVARDLKIESIRIERS